MLLNAPLNALRQGYFHDRSGALKMCAEREAQNAMARALLLEAAGLESFSLVDDAHGALARTAPLLLVHLLH